ncbi:hypothetical protein P255_03000 [Acinetobacter brisouii CIP 110357]|uniref:HTH cro/C1-type domain-containing protein n=1 Tax=Acinetobacter brisouii CIP 110357 TaxID=1341683 RepID=V2TZW5_9GAMM|nr:hypothetical protein [Acinetobacter brisouii]ENV46219.1 hypothetical protein F954_02854 [Acinetobacter brisouii ANC 4119]ESK47518.1 hypothetical protein P255_03000 [Acinetobacter brisouii CIP 110357]
MIPDSNNYNPDPSYLRYLVDKANVSQRKAAHIIGITERTMRYYMSDTASETYRKAPYAVQFALESLAGEWLGKEFKP